MLVQIKKKIKYITKSILVFYKNNLPQIVFLVFIAGVLFIAGRLPYINIISHYYFYAFALVWIIAIFLFKLQITMRMVLFGGLGAFVVAIPLVILYLDSLADIVGFVAYLLLLTYIIREIVVQREKLR